ncbi:MAG: MmgE/PrpD family protein [Mesorhizobium sp.]|uniref:MmgE/PrpD family protein n=1 Tax=Mesorhizobium sp. TaxID=1871066 RepID=UPI00121F8E54|nr:MAG: MmgE/PrpD family protein [Mesorhizobium sp.]
MRAWMEFGDVTLAEQIAEFVCGTADVPEAATNMTAKAIFDVVTASVAGYETASAGAARNAAETVWGLGSAAIWFSGKTSTISGASFSNAACASSQDLDDGHRAAAGHPGAAIIPAVLATLDRYPEHASRALAAIALGYEIAVRISAARGVTTVATTDSGLWCGQGVAAAVGWLRQFSSRQIAEAIAIAGTTAPSQAATPYTRIMGNNVKEGIPWATANGLLALELAHEGFSGPIDLLDRAERFDRNTLVSGLGASWQIEGTYFKPYGCCRWIHAAIDALLQIQADHQIAADDIHSLEVETFARALSLNNETRPATLEGAQYSVPFSVAVAAVHGPSALLPLKEEYLNDRQVITLAERVHVSVDRELDAMFSAAVPARVRITTAAATLTQEVLLPKGEPSNPMGWEDIDAKLTTVAAGRLDADTLGRLRKAVAALKGGEIEPLQSVLARQSLPERNYSAPTKHVTSDNDHALSEACWRSVIPSVI